jgi:hypothetical protein
VLDYVDEERDGYQFMEKFTYEAKMAAAAINSVPAALERERADVESRIAKLIPRLKASDGPALTAKLKDLEAERVRIAEELRYAATTHSALNTAENRGLSPEYVSSYRSWINS